MYPNGQNFTDEDRVSPVYCIGCRTHIPRTASNANRGLCAACIAKIQAPPPPPVGASFQQRSPPYPPPAGGQPPPMQVPNYGNRQAPLPQTLAQRRQTNLIALVFIGCVGLCVLCLPLVFKSNSESNSFDERPASSTNYEQQRILDEAERKRTAEAAAARQRSDQEYADRFAAVSRIFTDLGCRVDPLDPDYPHTMRAYLPSRLAMEMTDRQAREVAGMARSRLHSDAIVYVMSEGGQQLAKATPWGIQ